MLLQEYNDGFELMESREFTKRRSSNGVSMEYCVYLTKAVAALVGMFFSLRHLSTPAVYMELVLKSPRHVIG